MGSLLHDLLVGTLARGGEVTLQRQLYQAIQSAILQGRLPVDHKLPSTRALAQQLLVSRLTVSLAYERLLDEGYLYARAGSGTFVADTLPQVNVEALPGEAAGLAPLSTRGKAITARFGAVARVAGAFVPGVADADLFPFHLWKRLHNRYLSKRHADLSGYVDQGGYRPLREARDAFEKSYFEFHLAKENGSMTRVAEKTGLERTHLYRKLKQLGVDLTRNKRGAG